MGGTPEALAFRGLDRVRLLQALRERAPGAEDERLDSGLRDLELGGHLAIGEALPLPQQDRAALLLRHRRECVLDPDQLVSLAARARDDLLDHLKVARALDLAAAPRRAPSRETHVLGDLEQPRGLGLRHDAAAERSERVHERRLDGVLRLLARAELVLAVAQDLRSVTLVETLGRRSLRREARCFDEGRATNGRNCSQPGSFMEGGTGLPAFRPNACPSLSRHRQARNPFLGIFTSYKH